MDLPAEFNHLESCDLSIKTTGSPNAVCMADCLRVYDAASSGKPFHVVVILYVQDGALKRMTSITEVDLTDARQLLFGTLIRAQVAALDALVKSVPQKRKPTPLEHAELYSLKNLLQKSSAAIHLDIKCNSTQSRLQCSFNRFQQFLEANPTRVIARSITHEFRGGAITPVITSSRRVFNK
jgi:hypothetical protein